jgi:hypothetical protein
MFTPFKSVPFNMIGLLDCDKTRVTSLYLVKIRLAGDAHEAIYTQMWG